MTKEELIALADKHQEKADKAYKNYQETGITRYSRDYRNSEDLAAALRMAANAEEDHRSLTSLRVDISRVASSAAAAERAAEDLKLSRMTAVIKELLAVARLHGLILKLKKPSQNDFYNVNDFNANMDILEGEAAKAKSRQATLLVHAPAGYSIEVVHQSCAYTAVSTAVGNDAYATIVLPFGGCATINFRQNTQTEKVKCTLVEDLIADGRTTHIILSDDLIAYQSPLSAIPAGTYAAGGPCAPGGASGYVVTFRGKSHTIKRTSFDEFKTGYSKISDANKKLDAKNELWHAVRIGMITAANYKTITGEDYPNIPPVRVETKAAL